MKVKKCSNEELFKIYDDDKDWTILDWKTSVEDVLKAVDEKLKIANLEIEVFDLETDDYCFRIIKRVKN